LTQNKTPKKSRQNHHPPKESCRRAAPFAGRRERRTTFNKRLSFFLSFFLSTAKKRARVSSKKKKKKKKKKKMMMMILPSSCTSSPTRQQYYSPMRRKKRDAFLLCATAVFLTMTTVSFVAAAGEGSSARLSELRSKLSITESAIAKVTQELVARGEDVGEKERFRGSRRGSRSDRKEAKREENDGDGNYEDTNDDDENDSMNSCSPSCSKHHRCVDGKCRCPLLYSGPNCTENGFERAIDTNVFEKEKVVKCAMGVNHDPFHSQYEEKYGEEADRKMRVAHILRSRFIATTKESAPDLPDLLPLNTCAVVGSSGNIENNKNYGKDIDSHDVVIRFNDAPTVGYESVVGAKTTIRIQNSDFCAKGERGSKNFGNEVCIHYTASPPDRMCERDKTKGKGGSSAGNGGSCRLVYPSHRDSKYIFWYWKLNKIKGVEDLSCAENQKLGKRCNALKMSAGYYGIQLALNLCGKVNLYGFGTSRETKETKHYFVKKSASWDRKGWAQRHHWSYERFCIDQFEDGLIPGLKVNR
tara:strand:+ start:90 stop:1673 length:1584 start_codon:yes stop_codon:yes gene_type:complete